METINKKKTIQDLPEEIIEKILSYLDVESLKAAALTCRTLNETSSKMGWKLKLTFKNKMKEEPWVDVLLESNRKFNSIRLCEYAEMRNIRLMNFFEKHGRNLQKLVIDGGEFHSFKIFCDVLSSMPNLKKISFRNSDTRGRFANNFSEDYLPHLQKLETLNLAGSDFELMKYFNKTQINSFEIVEYGKEQCMENLLEFLTHQNNLKSLKLQLNSGWLISKFFKISFATENIPFKLKELSLDFKEKETLNDSNILKFLEFHSDTVEKLGVGCKLPDFVFEFIFAKLKRLTSLTFFGGRLPNDLPLYERLYINTSIKIISFSVFAMSEISINALKEFFMHVPNVEKLRIRGFNDLDTIFSTLTRLTHLELLGYSRNINQIKSQSLQSITIDCLAFIHDWKKIAANNPKVNKIRIKTIDETFDIVELLTNMKLQHLDLPVIKIDDNVCKALRENTQDMKSLRIHKLSFEYCQENLSDVKCLRFHDEDEVYD